MESVFLQLFFSFFWPLFFCFICRANKAALILRPDVSSLPDHAWSCSHGTSAKISLLISSTVQTLWVTFKPAFGDILRFRFVSPSGWKDVPLFAVSILVSIRVFIRKGSWFYGLFCLPFFFILPICFHRYHKAHFFEFPSFSFYKHPSTSTFGKLRINRFPIRPWFILFTVAT